MNKHRVWIEIVLVATGIACALAILIATLGAFAGAATVESGEQNDSSEPSLQQTYEGMITCSRCGARHSAEFARTATNCARICVHSGASFELVQGESTYLLQGNLEALKRVAGQRARVVGRRSGHTIEVLSAVPDAG